MRGRVNCLGFVMLPIVMLITAAYGHHDDERPHTLHSDSWVCVSQAAYELAKEGQRTGKGIQALRQQLRNEEGQDLCLHVDNEILEDMMAPWVKVLVQEGDQIKVAFTVEYYQRHNIIHREFSRVQFTGWTGADKLDIYIQ